MLVAHQDLGRRADDLERAHVVEVHVGRRVQRTQRTVQAQRRLGVALLQPLAHLHLHHVAGGDVLLGLEHRRDVGFLRELALHRVRRAAPDGRRRDRIAQLVGQLVEAALGGEEGVRARRIGVDDQVEPPGQVVDDGQLFGLQQQDVGRVEAARLVRAGQARLDVAHGVVAEIAREAAAKARQARTQRHLEALLERLDESERVAVVRLDDLAVGDHLGAHAGALHPRARRQADERVAPEALAADDGLQQEALRLSAGELEVQRQRRLEVGESLEDQRDAVETLGGQALEFEFGDHVRRTPVAGCAATRVGWVAPRFRRRFSTTLRRSETWRRPWRTRGGHVPARCGAGAPRRCPVRAGQQRQARAFITNGVARPRLPGRATAPRRSSRRCRGGRNLRACEPV